MTDELETLFKTTAGIRPREDAKRRANDAAMTVFLENQTNSEMHQGKSEIQRPTADNFVSFRRRMMNAINNRWIVSGVASAAVLVVTVSVIFTVGTPVPDITYDRKVAVHGADPSLDEVVVTARKQEVRAHHGTEPMEMTLPASASLRDAPTASRETLSAATEKARVAKMAQLSTGFSAGVRNESDQMMPVPGYEQYRDSFEHKGINPVHLVKDTAVSTFSIDVDTASYSFVRRLLNQGQLPPKDAVRVEEIINYFDYDYPLPVTKDEPFKATVSVVDSPWTQGNKLVHIGIRGYEMPAGKQPDSNLVFLLDVSGSMNSPDKLPLVKQSMALLLDQLKPTDTIAIVVYAGAAGTVLEPTMVKNKQKIMSALQRLNAGGSTAGGAGITLAYQLAESNFNKDAVNRVILATDGDFNVGVTRNESLKDFIERKRDSGIFLTVLGFGQGNYQDDRMQTLAQNGNGIAAYIDTLGEAQKVLVEEATSTLFPIARDVKLQIEFNPAAVTEYRLLGYESRMLQREDFNNDKVDAGDIGAGHRVTAIYEITPAGSPGGLIDSSRYGEVSDKSLAPSDEYGFLKIRYKLPTEEQSKLLQTAVKVAQNSPDNLRQEVDFATAVAGFAQLLQGGQYLGVWGFDDALALANSSRGDDPYGYRAEFVQLLRKAKIASAM